MKVIWAAVGLAIFLLVHEAAANPADDQTTVSKLDTKYQAAVKVNDAATMDRILAHDFVLVLGDGTVLSKADLLKDANSGRIQYEHQEELEQTVRVWAIRRWSRRSCGAKASTAANRSNGRCGSATRTCARPVGGDTCWAKPRCRYQKRNRMRVNEFRDLWAI